MAYFQNEYFLLTLTFGVFFLARYVQRRVGWAWLNPILVSILVLMGGPIAVSSYAMSVEMKGDGDLAAQIILVSTILVIPTFIAGITLLGTLGYL